MDEIVLRYAAAPVGGGIPSTGNVVLDGVRSDYAVASVTPLDAQTYVLHLDRPLGNDTAGGANGDRVRVHTPTGPDLTLNVLQGDVNKSGSVLADDFSAVKARFFKSTASPVTGTNDYSAFHDIDGSGSILANDFSAVKARFFDNLPAPAAAAADAQPASITRDLFSPAPIIGA